MKSKAKRHQRKSRTISAKTASPGGNPRAGFFTGGGVFGWLKWLNQPLGPAPATGAGVQHRLPRWFMLFLGMFGVGMILISLIGDQGLIAYHELQGEAETLKKEVARLEASRSRLFREIEALQGDPATIEHLARKNQGLVRPGDVVLQLPGKPLIP